jgi:hypothetical protein
MGPIEAKVREEITEPGALAEIAFALAESLDMRAGGASAAKELRALLEILTEREDRARRLRYAREDRERMGHWAMHEEAS